MERPDFVRAGGVIVPDSAKTKKKRSLRKKPAVSPSRRPSINIDVSKSEADAILSDLKNGSADNPQAALREVYALAIESVAQAFVDGLASFCAGFADIAKSEAFLNDNPIAPWIRRYIPQGDFDAESFRAALAEKIQASKASILSSLKQSLSENTPVGQPLAADNGESPIGAAHLRFGSRSRPMSQERLESLLNALREGDPRTGGPKTYKVVHTPRAYRFSFATGQNPAGEAKTCAPDPDGCGNDASRAVCDDAGKAQCAHAQNNSSADCSGTLRDAPGDIAVCALSGDVSANADAADRGDCIDPADQSTMPADQSPVFSDISDAAQGLHSFWVGQKKMQTEKMSQLSRGISAQAQELQKSAGFAAQIGDAAQAEISSIMESLAVRVADAVFAAYAGENSPHPESLGEMLKNDPRVAEDNALSEFICRLDADGETADPDAADCGGEITNEDLAHAFEQLLTDSGLDLG